MSSKSSSKASKPQPSFFEEASTFIGDSVSKAAQIVIKNPIQTALVVGGTALLGGIPELAAAGVAGAVEAFGAEALATEAEIAASAVAPTAIVAAPRAAAVVAEGVTSLAQTAAAEAEEYVMTAAAENTQAQVTTELERIVEGVPNANLRTIQNLGNELKQHLADGNYAGVDNTFEKLQTEFIDFGDDMKVDLGDLKNLLKQTNRPFNLRDAIQEVDANVNQLARGAAPEEASGFTKFGQQMKEMVVSQWNKVKTNVQQSLQKAVYQRQNPASRFSKKINDFVRRNGTAVEQDWIRDIETNTGDIKTLKNKVIDYYAARHENVFQKQDVIGDLMHLENTKDPFMYDMLSAEDLTARRDGMLQQLVAGENARLIVPVEDLRMPVIPEVEMNYMEVDTVGVQEVNKPILANAIEVQEAEAKDALIQNIAQTVQNEDPALLTQLQEKTVAELKQDFKQVQANQNVIEMFQEEVKAVPMEVEVAGNTAAKIENTLKEQLINDITNVVENKEEAYVEELEQKTVPQLEELLKKTKANITKLQNRLIPVQEAVHGNRLDTPMEIDTASEIRLPGSSTSNELRFQGLAEGRRITIPSSVEIPQPPLQPLPLPVVRPREFPPPPAMQEYVGGKRKLYQIYNARSVVHGTDILMNVEEKAEEAILDGGKRFANPILANIIDQVKAANEVMLEQPWGANYYVRRDQSLL